MLNRIRLVGIATMVALVGAMALVAPASAYPRPGRTELVSPAIGGGSSGISTGGDISADGRFVSFQSDAPDLVPEKTNRLGAAYVYDRASGAMKLVSVSSDGEPANGFSFSSGISADGRFAVFTSSATNLVPNDGNGSTDTFVHDVETGTTERVSVAGDGTEADAASQNATISGDGRYVAFASRATNIVEGGTNGQLNILVKDRVEGDVYIASRSSDGQQGNASSFFPELSDDGRYVVFHTFASNLVPDDANGRTDVYLHDSETSLTERVSLTWNGREANDSSNRAGVSANGRYVVFASNATNLVPNTASPNISPGDVYVRDRVRRTTERVSTTNAGEVGDRNSFTPQISPDGRYVILTSLATNLVRGYPTYCPPEVTNLARCRDVFLHDRELLRTERVSLGNNEVQGNSGLSVGSMTPDASVVAFFGAATNLVDGADSDEPDVFVRTRGQPLDAVDLRALPSATAVRVTGGATFSGAVLSQSPTRQLLIENSGIEIHRAELFHHPEEGDLLFRWRLNGMQTLPTSPRGPVPFQYLGFAFTTPTGRYEIRIQEHFRPDPPSTQLFETRVELYKCESSCVHIADLPGSFGTTGPEARASLPLKTIGLDETDPITGMRAYMALGHREAGELGRHQGVDLPNAVVPRAVVRVGVSSPDVSPDDVPMAPVNLDEGRFDFTLDIPPGESRVWIRTCLGTSCALRHLDVMGETPVEVVPASNLALTLDADGPNVLAHATLTDAETGAALGGREVSFEVNGVPMGNATTAEDGRATLTISRSQVKQGDLITARFAGDAGHEGSEASELFSHAPRNH